MVCCNPSTVDPSVDALLKQIEWHGVAVEDFIVEGFDVELRAGLRLTCSRSLRMVS